MTYSHNAHFRWRESSESSVDVVDDMVVGMRPKMTRKKCQNGCVGGSFVPRHVDSYTSMFSRFWGGYVFWSRGHYVFCRAHDLN